MDTIKAILNNDVIVLNAVSDDMNISGNQITTYNKVKYFNPDNAIINKNIKEKPSKYHKLNDNNEWVIDTSKKQEIIEAIYPNIDQATSVELSSGLSFEENIFPLIGDAYAYNMSGATAYVIGQSIGGRDLLDIAGNYIHVDNISGLVSLGDSTVTSIVKSAVDEKIALQSKTTSQLIEILASYE